MLVRLAAVKQTTYFLPHFVGLFVFGGRDLETGVDCYVKTVDVLHKEGMLC